MGYFFEWHGGALSLSESGATYYLCFVEIKTILKLGYIIIYNIYVMEFEENTLSPDTSKFSIYQQQPHQTIVEHNNHHPSCITMAYIIIPHGGE